MTKLIHTNLMIHANRTVHKNKFLCFCLSYFLLNFYFLCGQDIPDPFAGLGVREECSLIKKKEVSINLLGIIKEKDRFGAILVKDHQKEIVFLQDNVWGYKVTEISFNNVLLVRNGKSKKLEMTS